MRESKDPTPPQEWETLSLVLGFGTSPRATSPDRCTTVTGMRSPSSASAHRISQWSWTSLAVLTDGWGWVADCRTLRSPSPGPSMLQVYVWGGRSGEESLKAKPADRKSELGIGTIWHGCPIVGSGTLSSLQMTGL
eukprot:scaffold159858_cov31-Tisochrysis_lutea.AAC.2